MLVSVLVIFSLVEFNLRWNLFYDKADNHKPAFELQGITDEQWYWSHKVSDNKNLIEIDKSIGLGLKEMLKDKSAVVLVRSQCALAYYMGTDIICIDNSGLTDRYIARLPITDRGRVGHERSAPMDYIKERKVNYLFNRGTYSKENKIMALNVSGYKVKVEIFQ